MYKEEKIVYWMVLFLRPRTCMVPMNARGLNKLNLVKVQSSY